MISSGTLVRCIIATAILSAASPLCTAQQAWRYDFAAGDHLVYTETIHRRIDGSELNLEFKSTSTNHVLILIRQAATFAVGIQRNRTSAELLTYREKGRDKRSEEQPAFAERMARTTRFSEANILSDDGFPNLPWAAVREVTSRVLFAVHEIDPLPEKPVRPGDQWSAFNPLGLRFQYLREEPVKQQLCAVVEGSTQRQPLRLRYWFCPDLKTIAKTEFEAEYVTPAGTVRENVTFELQEKKRGEQLGQWIASPDTQVAVLRALLVTPQVNIAPSDLLPALSGSSDAQALALAIAHRRKLRLDEGVLTKLSATSDSRVARLAARLLSAIPPPNVCGASDESASQNAVRQPSGTTVRFMEDRAYAGYPYVLHVPDDYRGDVPFPLVVYLSGGPGLSIDAANSAEPVLGDTEFLALYPHAAGEMWWVPANVSRVRALLDEVQTNFNVDRSRVYIAGFSNGASGALYYSLLWPERFASVVSLMGGGICLPESKSLPLDKLAGIPVLFLHGQKDPIIPASCSEDTYKKLRKISPASELHILKNRQHDITLAADDGLSLPFLREYARCPGQSAQKITPAAATAGKKQ